MEAAAKGRMTAHEYLALERRALTKSEFLNGRVFAMAGGTREHSIIATNIAAEIHARVKGKPCTVYNSDMRLKVQTTEYFAYPDVQVACGEIQMEEAEQDTLLNPRIIVEVLSESTAAWDRGGKFWYYRHIEAFTDYVLISQETWLVEHYTRQPNGSWLFQVAQGSGGVLTLDSVGCSVPLADIYAKTNVDPANKPSNPKPESKL